MVTLCRSTIEVSSAPDGLERQKRLGLGVLETNVADGALDCTDSVGGACMS